MGEDPESSAPRAGGDGAKQHAALANGAPTTETPTRTPTIEAPTPTMATACETTCELVAVGTRLSTSGDDAVSLALRAATNEAAAAVETTDKKKDACEEDAASAAEQEAVEEPIRSGGEATPDALAARKVTAVETTKNAPALDHAHTNGASAAAVNGVKVTQLNGQASSADQQPPPDPGETEEGDAESDGVAVAPAPPADVACSTAKRPRSPAAKDDEELTAETSVEDVQSPEVICIDSDDTKDDTQEEEDEDNKATVTTSEASAEDGAESCEASARASHRRKKRARVLGFSHNKNRSKRHGSLAIASDAAPAEEGTKRKTTPVPATSRVRRQRSAEDAATPPADAESTVHPPPTAASSADMATWDWDSCRVFCDPLTQTSMDDLAAIRRESARVVSANSHMWGSIRRLEHDDAYLVSMAADVVADDVDHLRMRPVRRGRSFRDVWEEEDFLASQQRPTRTGKKRPFAGCEAISSNRELVWGYDDELFSAFISRLEARATMQAMLNQSKDTSNATKDPVERIEESPSRRLKSAKRHPVEKDTLPAVPSHHLHPASCGAWKLKGKDKPSFDSLHPAAIRTPKAPQRWVEELARVQGHREEAISTTGLRRSGRRESKPGDTAAEAIPVDDDDDSTARVSEVISDEAIELPNFGVVMEEDEISRELTGSLVRLVELSALNWRRTQTVYERAVSYIEVTPLLQAEEAAKQRLEQAYRTLYPPSLNPDEPDDENERELKFRRRPRDLVAFVTARSASVPTEAHAVCGSMEYALRLKRGEPIDVLDRNGCWNDGVVIDLYSDAGGDVKNVLVTYALWGGESTEWVPVIEARILPRGVADGRVSFTLGPTRGRKRLIELTKQTADLLQMTYPSRHNARFEIQHAEQAIQHDEDIARNPSKKHRRR